MIEAMAGIVENIQTPNQTPAMQRIALIIIKDKSCDFSLLAVKSLFRMQITLSMTWSFFHESNAGIT